MIKLLISPNSETPLYRQIVEQYKRAVALGHLSKGDALPSVRALSEQLVINPNTVARAYQDLVRQGVAYSHPGKGLFIASRRDIYSKEERERRFSEALKVFLNEAYFLSFNQKEILDHIRAEWSRFNGDSE